MEKKAGSDTVSASLPDLTALDDELSEKVLMEKLKNLFDLETTALMDSRLVQTGSATLADDSKAFRSTQQEKTYTVEHRIELLNQAQVEKDVERSFAYAEAVAQYGEKRLMSQIDSSAQAMIEVVPALSAQIFNRRKDVYEAFANAKMVEKLADIDFNILRQYYSTTQKNLNAKFSNQEKTYLQYELDGMDRQLAAMDEIFENSHAASKTRAQSAAGDESHRRCDELFQWFCDRSLELQYANSTKKQDCAWRVEDARHAANKWRYAASEELESSLQQDVSKLEGEYMAHIEGLSEELQELRQRQLEASLEKLRIHNLASIPPFALKLAAQERDRQEIQLLESALKHGAQPDDHINLIEESSKSLAYRLHAGSHIVELANASHLESEQLVEDLHALLASVSVWQNQVDQQQQQTRQAMISPRSSHKKTPHMVHADEAKLLRSLSQMLQAARKAKKSMELSSIPSPGGAKK